MRHPLTSYPSYPLFHLTQLFQLSAELVHGCQIVIFKSLSDSRFQLLLSLFRRRLKIRPLLPGLFQRLFPLFLLFGCQNPGRQSIQLPSQKFLLLLPFFQPYSGLIPEFLNRLKVLLVPKPAPVRSFRKPCRIWKSSSQTTRGIPAPGIPW